MRDLSELPGLSLRSELITPRALNFLPASWPIPPEFPVVMDASGNVVSRYGDSSWDLSPWHGKALKLNFFDKKTQLEHVSQYNAELLKEVVAWWLYGPDAAVTSGTLALRFTSLKPIFTLCTEHGIYAADLTRFPRVLEELPTRLPKSQGDSIISYLRGLFLAREWLGFVLLDDVAIMALAAAMPDHARAQTPYIPPRIWAYQVTRLRECLDDYLAHQERLEECYEFCLHAYAKNSGGLINQAFRALTHEQIPFQEPPDEASEATLNCVYHGPFTGIAKRFGINELLAKWGNQGGDLGISAISSYLSLISWVGTAYTINFSLMRIDEASMLRSNCHSVERDELGQDIHLIGGVTTKTNPDGDARWIVSPSVQLAIEVLSRVARLRMRSAVCNPFLQMIKEDVENPVLLGRSHEPWVRREESANSRTSGWAYAQVARCWPRLFDVDELRIRPDDLEIARLLTPTLDPIKFEVGKVWPIGWHQLRRTGAVNMFATGLVSDGALQYQLKHANRAMSRYYGQNHYHLRTRVDEDARAVYVRTMYEAIGREFALLSSDRFFSPHGDMRKAQILSTVCEGDHKQLVKAAKLGKIAYREIIFGGCTYPGQDCPFGGISNVAHCMGYGSEKPCEAVLLDRQKLPRVIELRAFIVELLRLAEVGSPKHESLSAQMESVERALELLNG